MWETPIYKFKANIRGIKKTILIDVTGSAPNFKIPGKQLSTTLNGFLKGMTAEKTSILDFGAAKLRNTIYLLKKGFKVYSVEFDDLFKRSKQAHTFLKEAETYSNFNKLIFPDEFISNKKKFDAILLINVLNIMPVSLERYYVLMFCREKMKKGGKLLWYTQHGVYSGENSFAKLYGGYVMGKGRKYNTYYTDFTRDQIHEMLSATGFSFDNLMQFPKSGSNQAYGFRADGPILLDRTLPTLESTTGEQDIESTKIIERTTRWKKNKRSKIKSEKITFESVIPKKATALTEVKVLKEYLKELKLIETGGEEANRYHHLVFNILKSVFGSRLTKPKMEDKIAGGIKRVDISFRNPQNSGFFRDLKNRYEIRCANIYIECKNIKHDPVNPEFDQLGGRLNDRKGQFGILVCRKILKPDTAKKRQDDLRKQEKYIIYLNDIDLRKIANYTINGEDELVDDFLEEKLKEVL